MGRWVGQKVTKKGGYGTPAQGRREGRGSGMEVGVAVWWWQGRHVACGVWHCKGRDPKQQGTGKVAGVVCGN